MYPAGTTYTSMPPRECSLNPYLLGLRASDSGEIMKYMRKSAECGYVFANMAMLSYMITKDTPSFDKHLLYEAMDNMDVASLVWRGGIALSGPLHLHDEREARRLNLLSLQHNEHIGMLSADMRMAASSFIYTMIDKCDRQPLRHPAVEILSVARLITEKGLW